MHRAVGRDRVDEIKHRVNERMFVADNVTGRPPRAKIWMRALRAQNSLEPRLVPRITTIAVLQFVHSLEAECNGSLGAVDFETIVILVPRRQARRLKRAVRTVL